MNIEEEKIIEICYTNWRGETDQRKIQPLRLIFDQNQWHQEKQWLLEAIDLGKNAVRFFAVKDIHDWKSIC